METGILVYGDNLRRKTVRISDHLARLNGIESVQLVHYGAYETRFLRTMKKRYVSEPHEVEFVDRLLTSSVNLVAYSRDNGH